MPNNALNISDISNLDTVDAKQRLRAKVRLWRKNRSERELDLFAQQWIETVLDYVYDCKTVAAFVSIPGEPPTHRLCEAIADSGKTLLLPKLGPRLTRAWGYFRGLSDLAQLAPGRPPEPSGAAFDNRILSEVDVMLVPALLVSRYGERLGQGGGWYDRALKEVQPDLPIGALIFPNELVDFHLPQDENDMRVHHVILPDQVISVSSA